MEWCFSLKKIWFILFTLSSKSDSMIPTIWKKLSSQFSFPKLADNWSTLNKELIRTMSLMTSFLFWESKEELLMKTASLTRFLIIQWWHQNTHAWIQTCFDRYLCLLSSLSLFSIVYLRFLSNKDPSINFYKFWFWTTLINTLKTF